MFFAHLLAAVLAGGPQVPSGADQVVIWPTERASVSFANAPQYRVERLHRTAQELADRAASVVALFATEAARRSRVLRWARKAIDQDPRRWLQFHPLPESQPGLVVMYQPLNDDLFVMDLDQLHDTPTPQFQAPPVTPDVGVGEAEARRLMIGTLADLEAQAILPAGYSAASATLGVYRERQGNGQGGQAEWVTEYQWTMNRILDGVEIVDAGVRIGIHRDGGLSSLRITDVEVQPLAATGSPVVVDLPLARETFVAHELARNPTATLRVTRERIAVVLDPSTDFADLTPSVLFNYSLRFEDPATGAVNLSRQQLTTVSLTTGDVHQVFPEGVAP